METPPPSPSHLSTSPSWTTASGRLSWGQRLSWLISALSGTVETEIEIERLKNETERLRNEQKQIENETKQIRKENERLAELESKIDALFSKYGINLPQAKKQQHP